MRKTSVIILIGILLILSACGKTEIKHFSTAMQVFQAQTDDSLDASVLMSTAYMEGYNKENNTNIYPLTFVLSEDKNMYR